MHQTQCLSSERLHNLSVCQCIIDTWCVRCRSYWSVVTGGRVAVVCRVHAKPRRKQSLWLGESKISPPDTLQRSVGRISALDLETIPMSVGTAAPDTKIMPPKAVIPCEIRCIRTRSCHYFGALLTQVAAVS